MWRSTGIPEVIKIDVSGELVEGNTIKVYAEVAWCGGTLLEEEEYELSLDDIGSCLLYMYTPITEEGAKGEPQYAITDYVKAAPPSVSNVQITGDAIEGCTIRGMGVYFGGKEGPSTFEWLREDNDNGLEGKSMSAMSQIVKQAPPKVTNVKIISELKEGSKVTLTALPPNINFLSITGDYSEGGVLTASYGYIGGHEGKSIYNWYLHEVESDSGTLIPEVSGSLQYRIPKDAIGKFISFTCTPVRDDGIESEREPALDKNVFVQTSSNGSHNEISGATSSSYMFSVDDIGFFTSVSCEPIRSDGARGPIVLSEQGLQHAGSLEFHGSLVEGSQLSFIASYSGGVKGDCLYEWFRVKDDGLKEKLHVEWETVELVYPPVRAHGLKGAPKTLISCHFAPGEPVGVGLLIPDCCEGQEVVPATRYFGGREADGKYIWFRTENKLDESALIELSNNCENVDICGQELTYTPSLEDVGFYLALYWLPTRSDGKCGSALVSICDSPVIPALPIVNNVRVEKLSSSTYNGEGEYFGGYEGESCFSWYRESDDGTVTLIGGANSKTYEVSDEDIIADCYLEVPRIEILALTGKAVEGELLTAVEVIPNSENQHLVWGKYKKEVKHQWFFSSESGTDIFFEPFPSQRSCLYKVRFEDIGAPRIDKLAIEGRVAIYTPIRDDGVDGQPVSSASTDPIAVEPDVHKEVKQKLDLGSMKFEAYFLALCDKDRSPKRVPGMGSLEIRILEVNRKRVKVVKPGSKTSFPTTETRGSYSPPFHVELFRNNQHHLRIVVDKKRMKWI
ncbi:187-kda microtubule-associated protein air9 [Phtheirospermum japonicum]|uniref:187-kDa microtubule-associated protein air9 n=1 Tax=Phtheirospermum japonicum TaxID=374723 RepID=A0A830B9P1_9LAMI|nr:187-kda microtubule-associated protein air9 [Phtheirospermum japonicum]